MAEIKHTLFACVTCDPRGEADSPDALGHKMHQALHDAVNADAELRGCIEVKPVTCMGGCEQPCSVAFAAPEKITWVFTHQHPDKVSEVIETAKLYVQRKGGQMLREERAPQLQENVFCKIPAVK